MTLAKTAPTPLTGASVSKSIKQSSKEGQGKENSTEEVTGLDAQKTTSKENTSSVKAKAAALDKKQKDGIPSRIPDKKALEELFATTEKPNFGVEKSPSSGGSGSSAGGGQGGSGGQSGQQPNFGNSSSGGFAGSGQGGGSGNGSNQANNGWLGQPNVQPPRNDNQSGGGNHHQPQSFNDFIAQQHGRGNIDSIVSRNHNGHTDTLLSGVDQDLVGRISQGAREAGLNMEVACKDGSCSIELSPHAKDLSPTINDTNHATELMNNDSQEMLAQNEPEPPPPPEPQVQEAVA